MTEVKCRMADGLDAEIVARFVHALVDELSGGKAPEFSETLGITRQILTEDTVIPVIAEIKGVSVGVMVLNECQAIYAGGKFGEISELYVRNDLRSKGLATCLVNQAVSIGRGKGWKRLEVGAPKQPEWQRTLAFYLRNDFLETGPRLRRLI